MFISNIMNNMKENETTGMFQLCQIELLFNYITLIFYYFIDNSVLCLVLHPSIFSDVAAAFLYTCFTTNTT